MSRKCSNDFSIVIAQFVHSWNLYLNLTDWNKSKNFQMGNVSWERLSYWISGLSLKENLKKNRLGEISTIALEQVVFLWKRFSTNLECGKCLDNIRASCWCFIEIRIPFSICSMRTRFCLDRIDEISRQFCGYLYQYFLRNGCFNAYHFYWCNDIFFHGQLEIF